MTWLTGTRPPRTGTPGVKPPFWLELYSIIMNIILLLLGWYILLHHQVFSSLNGMNTSRLPVVPWMYTKGLTTIHRWLLVVACAAPVLALPLPTARREVQSTAGREQEKEAFSGASESDWARREAQAYEGVQ